MEDLIPQVNTETFKAILVRIFDFTEEQAEEHVKVLTERRQMREMLRHLEDTGVLKKARKILWGTEI